jgi:exodeoxyribonuclease-1
MNNSIYWYDYETFGISPKFDRASQFGGIRTDEDLNIIDEPLKIYNRPTPDFVPSPEACLVTGIVPQDCMEAGLNEIDFITEINEQFAQPKTTVCGYNNIQFDDEFTRYTLYRNLMDPYAREWQNGNSRWDLINLVRLTSALRPDGINWPINEKDLPSFRLEHLTNANGIAHTDAHDALSDVYATIAVAKLIKEKQPKLYDYIFNHRLKHQVVKLIDCANKTPLVHSSSKFLSEYHNTTLVVPLCWHPKNKNSVIAYDLRHDPSDLINLNSDQIIERLYTTKEALAESGMNRVALKTIQINKAPVLAPINTLDDAAKKRTQLDMQLCQKHLEQIKQAPSLDSKLADVFGGQPLEADPDVDAQLYGGGFFSPRDKNLMEQVLETDPDELVGFTPPFKDKRLAEMLFRFRARNYPETLDGEEQQRWKEFCSERVNNSEHYNLSDFDQTVEAYECKNEKEIVLIQKLKEYRKALV